MGQVEGNSREALALIAAFRVRTLVGFLATRNSPTEVGTLTPVRLRHRTTVTLVLLPIALMIATGFFCPEQVRSAPKAEDDFQLIKVADGVYAAIAKPGGLASGNAGFVIGDEGVLIFDTFFTPAALEELIVEIQTLTKLPIKFAVNSHYHLDHTGGNQVLSARGVPIFAHDNVSQWQTTKNKRFLPAAEDLQKRPQIRKTSGLNLRDRFAVSMR